MMNVNASIRSIKGRCRKLLFQEESPGADASDIVIAPCCLPDLYAYQYTSTGTITNNAKNQGWPKTISLK